MDRLIRHQSSVLRLVMLSGRGCSPKEMLDQPDQRQGPNWQKKGQQTGLNRTKASSKVDFSLVNNVSHQKRGATKLLQQKKI